MKGLRLNTNLSFLPLVYQSTTLIKDMCVALPCSLRVLGMWSISGWLNALVHLFYIVAIIPVLFLIVEPSCERLPEWWFNRTSENNVRDDVSWPEITHILWIFHFVSLLPQLHWNSTWIQIVSMWREWVLK